MPLHRTDSPDCRGGFVTIGNFDGVHRGHRAMLARLRELADAAGVPPVAVTFDPPPVAILRPEKLPPRLTTLERRTELLKAAGADHVVAYPVDADLLKQSPEAFFRTVVLGRLGAVGVLEGPNFHFGRDRAGDVKRLAELCSDHGLACEIVAPTADEGGEMISSTRVRRLIAEGDVASAADLLGSEYVIDGVVTRGAGRGRGLGFPTANLTEIETLVPGHGVYAAVATVDGESYAAAVHIGPNVTFGEETATVEAHLLDFDGDLYGRRLSLAFRDRVRGTRRFDDPATLRDQLTRDVAEVRRVCV